MPFNNKLEEVVTMEAGYRSKVLFVDLKHGHIKEEVLPEELYRDFMGCGGLGVRILYERMKPKADPFRGRKHAGVR